MIQGVLNDRNNLFLHVYYAPFFLGSSNTSFWEKKKKMLVTISTIQIDAQK